MSSSPKVEFVERPYDEIFPSAIIGPAELVARLDEQKADLREQHRSKLRSDRKQKELLSYAQTVLTDLEILQRDNSKRRRDLQRCEQLMEKRNEVSAQRKQRAMLEQSRLTNAQRELEFRVQNVSHARREHEERVAEARGRQQAQMVQATGEFRQLMNEKKQQVQKRSSSDQDLRRYQSANQRQRDREGAQAAVDRMRQQKAENRDREIGEKAKHVGSTIDKTLDRIKNLEEQKQYLLAQIEAWEERKDEIQQSLSRSGSPVDRYPLLSTSRSWQGTPRRGQIPPTSSSSQVSFKRSNLKPKSRLHSDSNSPASDSTAPSTIWNSDLGSFAGSPKTPINSMEPDVRK